MALKKKERKNEEASVPLSSMIDIVFLLIIFFVVTASLDKEVQDQEVQLAFSPNGKVVEKIDKKSFTINIRKDGSANIGGTPKTKKEISNELNIHALRAGKSFPIILRCDKDVKHGHIMSVQDAVTNTGMFSVRYNAQQK